jgi:enediyne biosynthesis thioesterase
MKSGAKGSSTALPVRFPGQTSEFGGVAVRAYEYRHVVGFEETSLVGNVYFANHIRWQGRCRELFLKEHAPEILQQLREGLALVTVRCSCQYLMELSPFDEVTVRMRLACLAQNRISLSFEYWRQAGPNEQLVARGDHEVACMKRLRNRTVPVNVPESLRSALEMYSM